MNGAIGVGEDYRDFLIGSTVDLPELKKQDTKIYEYNQGRSKDCTIYSAIGAVSDLKNFEFNKKEIAEIVELSYEAGRTPGKGRYTQAAVKLVCKWWNDNFSGNPVVYYRIELDSQQAHDAMNKNYTLSVTYRGNSKYNLEYLKYILITSWEFGKKTYGHAVNMIKRKGKVFIKDNYEGRTTKYGDSNIYGIKPTLGNMVKSTYFTNAYLIVNGGVDKIEELKRLHELQFEVEDAIEQNSWIWHKTNDGKYKNELHNMNNHHRTKLLDIQKEMDKFT